MAKFVSLSCFLFLFLVISATTVIQQTHANRCSKMLAVTGCKLLDCKKQCFQLHGENSGLCLSNGAGDYGCFCSWEC
ncbi:hypothetical protein SAY87_031811 [Trapa incisa]|uniref:Defensin-like protein n=1 Tax=Trapa incisa TaxID=236973 RepID=A0AAN7KRS7_9MYRT|nr:hypothetical protein SAY87_031811 [Trapa incisa]